MACSRLIIADPSLLDERGHHYTLTKAITQSASSRGAKVIWLTNQNVSAELKSNFSNTLPYFGQSMYDPYKVPTALQSLKRNFKRLLDIKNPNTIKSDTYLTIAHSIFLGLQKANDELHFTENDYILFHTADGSTYKAIADFIKSANFIKNLPDESLPQFHICTPYDPVGVMPNRRSSDELLQIIRNFRALDPQNKYIHLYGENEDLASHLSALWETTVRPLPLPAIDYSEEEIISAQKFRREVIGISDNTFLMISLGAARIEKGFHLFPDIIRRVFEFAGQEEYPDILPEEIHFALHASPQIIGRHHVISNTLNTLSTLPTEQVTVFTKTLPDKSYKNLLLASDAVILPYNSQDYNVRGSGIVSEAISANKFIIGTKNSFPGRSALKFAGGCGETPKEMALSALDIMSKLSHRRDEMMSKTRPYIDDNLGQNYFDKLTRQR